MNRHPYDEQDIAVATAVISRIYAGVDANHGVAAVAVLDAVMVARHRRDAGYDDAQPIWKRLIRALARN